MNDHETEIVRRMRHDESVRTMREIAEMVAAYHARLIASGMDRDDAETFALSLQYRLLDDAGGCDCGECS